MKKINVKELNLDDLKAYGNKEYDQVYNQMYESYGSNFERQIKKMFEKINEENLKALAAFREGTGDYETVTATANMLDSFKRTVNNIAFDTNHFWEAVGEK
jgi:hypothetical protein